MINNKRFKLIIKHPLLSIYGLYIKMFMFFTRPISIFIKKILYSHYYIFGGGFNGKKRVKISSTAVINDAFLNVNSGDIIIKDYVFTGHGVSLITGTHDYSKFNFDRIITSNIIGNDIIVENGVWIGANSTILGPSIIGKYSVIASGAVVTKNIPPYEVWGGVPAKKIKEIKHK